MNNSLVIPICYRIGFMTYEDASDLVIIRSKYHVKQHTRNVGGHW